MSTDDATGSPLDLWSWVDDADDAPAGDPVDPADVTAVMVVHNAAEWLPRQLLALAGLEPRPGRVIAVDTGSLDAGPELLAAAHAEGVIDDVLTATADLGFGEAVALALEGAEPDWIWLLHDDSSPRRDALGALLAGARETGAAVLVPKLLQPRRRNYPETLAEVGQSISASGRRVVTVEEGDIDQEQESPTPVLGGSTAGMLVRGDVWRELGGLAPELPLHRDGVDLGWRAAEAGHLVTTWPDAALTHRQSGRTGERTVSLARTTHEIDRLAALRLVAARGPQPRRPVALFLGSLLRALGFLLLKSPQTAGAELRAARRLVSSPEATDSLRGRSVAQPADVTELLPGRWWGVGHAFDRFGNAVAERYRDLMGSGSGTGIDELTGDDFAGGLQHRRITSPLVGLFVVLLLAGVVAGRTLLGSGPVAGGGLLPAPRTLTDAWAAYLTPVAGAGGGNAPWLGFNAFFSTFFFGSPGWFALAALVVVPVVAAFAAHRLVAALGGGRALSTLVGLLWAGAVIVLGVVTAGDMSGMVVAVAAPMLARSVVRVARDDSVGTERLRAPAGAAFWLLAVAVAWPFALLVATVAGVVWGVRDRSRLVDLLVGLGLPWLFLAPWFPTLARWPGRLLTGADPLAWPAFPPASSATLVGRILPSGLPLWLNIAFFAVLGLAALAGLLLLESSRTRLVVAAGIVAPLLAGVSLSRLSLEVNGGESRALLSPWALLVVAGLIVAALLPHLRRDDAVGASRVVRVGAAALGAAGLIVAGTWAWVGFAGPVGQSPSELPGYVRDVVASPRDTRVLMVELVGDGSLAWNVVDADQPTWGTGERNPAGAFAQDFAGLVQALSGGDAPEDLAERLARLGVGHVWMKGFGQDRLAAIGNAAGLSRAQAGDDVVVWTVLGQVSRAQLLGGATAEPLVHGVVPEGEGARWVLLAEEADPRRWASVDGVELPLAVERPPVTFAVPDGVHGPLEHGLRPAWGAVAWQVGLLLVLALLAAPTLASGTAARRGAA